MRNILITGLSLLIVSATASGLAQDNTPPTIVVQFKIFDANKPNAELQPDLERRPIILLRDLETKAEELFLGNKFGDIVVTASKDRTGFYEVILPKGRLISEMSIEVAHANTNPAVLSRMITSGDIVVYLAASSSLVDCTLSAYVAQLNRYKSLITQLVDQFPDRSEVVREVLRERYGGSLLNMKTTLEEDRVFTVGPQQERTKLSTEQSASARRSLNEVLVAYGLISSEKLP
jgi:hypothetical protein